mmetsp:Transcript_76609/g.217127  ORF Transcript_76609/g.217127 Transcript_76609/m.217127 type:complete len:381 (-) Transcript_76609:362-1504(-)
MVATSSSSESISSRSAVFSAETLEQRSATFFTSTLIVLFSSSWLSMRLAKYEFCVCSCWTLSPTTDISFSAFSWACCEAVTASSDFRFFFFSTADSCSASRRSCSASTLASLSIVILACKFSHWRSRDVSFLSRPMFSASCFLSSSWFNRRESISAYTLSAVSRQRSEVPRFSSWTCSLARSAVLRAFLRVSACISRASMAASSGPRALSNELRPSSPPASSALSLSMSARTFSTCSLTIAVSASRAWCLVSCLLMRCMYSRFLLSTTWSAWPRDSMSTLVLASAFWMLVRRVSLMLRCPRTFATVSAHLAFAEATCCSSSAFTESNSSAITCSRRLCESSSRILAAASLDFVSSASSSAIIWLFCSDKTLTCSSLAPVS